MNAKMNRPGSKQQSKDRLDGFGSNSRDASNDKYDKSYNNSHSPHKRALKKKKGKSHAFKAVSRLELDRIKGPRP